MKTVSIKIVEVFPDKQQAKIKFENVWFEIKQQNFQIFGLKLNIKLGENLNHLFNLLFRSHQSNIRKVFFNFMRRHLLKLINACFVQIKQKEITLSPLKV